MLMDYKGRIALWIVLIPLAMMFAGRTLAAARGDDYAVTLSSSSSIDARRAQLIDYIWGSSGFPSAASILDNANAPSPVTGVENLQRVEKLKTVMSRSGGAAVEVSTFHLVPIRKRNRLVVVVHGHGCHSDFNDGSGLADTIKALVWDGYGVAAILMPSSEQCDITHAGLYSEPHPLRYFLEPTAKSLNYIAQHYPYRQFNMIGLSGGGWTTTVYAAVDTRIKTSIPVAGSIPLYLRHDQYNDDIEQFDPGFYGIAGFPDLYLMGGYGPGRRQIQVLNVSDECCFGAHQHKPELLPRVPDDPPEPFETSVRLYESRIESALSALGPGSFRVVLFDVPGHLIPADVIRDVVRHTLNADDPMNVLTPILF
jgi:pimeloyl-ACP methyl ester carboxylesterase